MLLVSWRGFLYKKLSKLRTNHSWPSRASRSASFSLAEAATKQNVSRVNRKSIPLKGFFAVSACAGVWLWLEYKRRLMMASVLNHAVLNYKRSVVPKLAALTLLLGLSAANSAQAVTLFSENFEGYTSFPTFDPFWDPVNSGIAKTSEGANEVWYGARFETPDNGSINEDLAIQKFGGGSNMTHTGRVEDDAGMLFKIDTTGLSNVNLSFDWRTFLTTTSDRFVVGYHVGAIAGFGTCTGNGEAGCFADLRTSLPWYTNQNDLNPTTTGNWTQLLRASQNNSWTNQSYTLGNDANNQSEVWIAFWMDNGEGDYAKFDNVSVSAVPEADSYAMLLAGLGLVGYTVSRRKRTL
jgi:hypothetical protein